MLLLYLQTVHITVQIDFQSTESFKIDFLYLPGSHSVQFIVVWSKLNIYFICSTVPTALSLPFSSHPPFFLANLCICITLNFPKNKNKKHCTAFTSCAVCISNNRQTWTSMKCFLRVWLFRPFYMCIVWLAFLSGDFDGTTEDYTFTVD